MSEQTLPTVEEVREILRAVIDPEIGLPIVDLGLVYEIEVHEGGKVRVVYTLTSLGCPVGPMIESNVRQLLESIPGVDEVELEMTFRPPWTPDMMDEEAKAALGYF
ncbi:MAG TPA: metal-sulfur cluster assembly factor [Actinomycetota bacterium]|nr:metal-sulfur cluster assembly factor [Actinomycetota bacterium]